MTNEILSSLARMFGGNIPGVGASAVVYYNMQKNQFSSEAKTANQTIEEYLENKLKIQVANAANLSEYELASLALDLSTFFKADKYFRKGWVVDDYWVVYGKCTQVTQLGLDAASGW